MFVIDATEMSGTYFRWKSGKDKQVLSRLMLFDNRLLSSRPVRRSINYGNLEALEISVYKLSQTYTLKIL